MAISLKRVKIEEKLLWRAYRKSPTLFRIVPSATPTTSSSLRLDASRGHLCDSTAFLLPMTLVSSKDFSSNEKLCRAITSHVRGKSRVY